MARTPEYKKSMMAKRAEPIRVVLMELVKNQLQTRERKADLAKFMGISLHYVHSMIYYGEGGLDAWLNALIFCFDLDVKRFRSFLLQRPVVSAKPTPTNKANKIWRALDQTLSAKEKERWARILQAAIRASNRYGSPLVRRERGG